MSLWYVFGAAFLLGLVLLVWPKTRRFAKRWLLWVTGVYVVFGLPVVANAIAGTLPKPAHSAPTQPVRALIILDGDNRRGRLREALTVLRRDDPPTVWILGDEWFLDELEAEGYPRDRFLHETETTNTREQMQWVARFAADHPGTEPVLVVSRLQTPRVVGLARAAGTDATIVSSPIDDEPPTAGWRLFVPSYVALRTSRDALYEHCALWWYWWKGWIG